jgi:hypothetical protein
MCAETAERNPPNPFLKERDEGKGLREYNKGGELAQNSLCASMEFSHETP